MMQGEILFKTANGALVFAFNFSSQAYDRPTMNRMAAPSLGNGKGLVGLDGAAQAGFVLAEVKAMGKFAEAILIARLAPRSTNCECRASCCSGRKPNRVWTDAIAFLADHVRTTALAGCVANGMMRREYVVRYFAKRDERTSLEELADKHDIARQTVSAHASKVVLYFGGSQARKDKPATPGFESIAFNAIEDRLREIGMVGELAA
jgi:hypothetical protein